MEMKINVEEARFYSQLSIFKDPRDVVAMMENVQRAVRDYRNRFDDPEEWSEAKRFIGRWFDVYCKDI